MSTTPLAPTEDRSTSPLAIVGLVLAFLLPLVGAIISLVALGQTDAGKRGGRGLAIAGAIIGFLLTIVGIVVAVFTFIAAGAAVEAGSEGLTEISENLDESYQTKADVDAGTIDDFSPDFALGPVATDEFATVMEVTVTNSGATAYTYSATIAAVSADGATQYETAYVTVAELAPGQTSVQDASFFEQVPDDATYELVDYSRTSY